MNTDLTEIACIIDRSGSMSSLRTDAIGGFNTFLESQKKQPGQARLTLVLFDHEYQLLHNGADLQQVPPLDESTYVPRGTTALLDAIGRTLDDVGQRLSRTPEPERPGKVIVAILTDGLENASRDYSGSRIAEMIEHQRSRYAWDFVFLAANQDAITTAEQLAIPAADAISYVASDEGMHEAYAMMDVAVARKRRRK